MSEGMPALLDVLGELGVCGTFFVTGEMARRFPEIVARLVAAGHELGCHGDKHRDFTTLSHGETEAELAAAIGTLRAFGPVESFRAPYLRFPTDYLSLLVRYGLLIDSSIARYKFGPNHRADRAAPGLVRVPASATSSVLRLPPGLARWWLGRLRQPLVLFVHPWEAIDLRTTNLRWDCRFATGVAALARWRQVLSDLLDAGFWLRPLREIAAVNWP
jgi:peptidoglycan/xylan/chitin deacetylase (PgdA/CDA1 family)